MIRDDHTGELYILPKVTRPFKDDAASQHPLIPSSLPAAGSAGQRLKCRRSDLVQQFFLARTAMLRNANGGGWDDRLKNNDHYDAMLSFQRQHARLYVCRGLSIGHNALACGMRSKNSAEEALAARYKKVRSNRWMSLMPYWLRKWNVTAVHDEVGRRWSLDPESGKARTRCGVGCSDFPAPKFKWLPGRSDHEHPAVFQGVDQDFAEAMRLLSRSINAQRPSWDALTLVDLPPTKVRGAEVQVQILGPCERLYKANIESGNIDVKWRVRPPPPPGEAGIKKKKPKRKKDVATGSKKVGLGKYIEYLSLVQDQSCPIYDRLLSLAVPRAPPSIAEQHRDVTAIEMADNLSPVPNRLFYVTVVSDVHAPSVSRLLQQVARQLFQPDDLSITLVVVAMGGTKKGLASWEKTARATLGTASPAGVQLVVVATSPPFGRSIGLKMGFAEVGRIVKVQSPSSFLQSRRGTAVFSLDASMVLPEDFSKGVVRGVRCGISAYAPVCWKKSRSVWAEYAYGMVGVCLEDYDALVARHGGWREHWWYRWGAEDVDMIQQLQSQLIIHRPRVDGYAHVSGKETRVKNPAYYEAKNSWPGDLPVVPVSESLLLRRPEKGDPAMGAKKDDAHRLLAGVDDVLRRRLEAFVRKSTRRPLEKFDGVVWRTAARPQDDTVLFSLWTRPEGRLRVVAQAKPEHDAYAQPAFRDKPGEMVKLRLLPRR